MRALPPTRTTRISLQRRLATASRAIGVLEEKAHALTREHRRLRHQVDETRRAWADAGRDADRWFVRAAVLGGLDQLDLVVAHLGAPAQARVTWRSIMGVTYPSEAHLDLAQAIPLGSVARTGALEEAASAYRRAVAAALDHAAATRALALVEVELGVTRRRLRALENRWVPHLRDGLHDVELALAAMEQEDAVRARWVSRRGAGDAR